MQLKEDGTEEHFSRDFEPFRKTSKTSKTSKTTTEFECYCTVYVTGGVSQGTGWYFPESVVMYCSDCYGVGASSSSSEFGTSTGTSIGTNTTISTVWANGGGSAYGYTVNYTGQQAYVGLYKKYLPDHPFSSLQRYNIINNPEVSAPLLDFLNTDGNTQSDKNFVLSVIDAIEEGSVASYQEASVLINAYKIVKTSLLIENQIDDMQLDTCLKGIMGQLKNATNADIASVMTKLGAKNNYTVTMKMGAMTRPEDFAETTKISKNNYLITVTPDTYTSSTKLYRATALLHEIIHAYMLSVVDDYNTYPTNAPFTDFPELFTAYVSKTRTTFNPTFAQHEDMANKYVDAIASALEEYQTNTTGIPSSLADKQVFLDMAWSGLQGTDVYNRKSQEGIINDTRITARVSAEQTGSYRQGQYPVGKPCN